MKINEKELRNIMSYFPTGVTIVTTVENNKPYGLTVNSFTSVSLNPPLVLICIMKGRKSNKVLSNSKFFIINFLSKDQEYLSKRFSDPLIEDKRFENLEYEKDENGFPLIKNCLAYIKCEKFDQVDLGDHTVFIGKVIKIKKGIENFPLIFYRKKYFTLNNI